ncbi:unnamed protein product [Discula destructiva]
MAPPPGRKRSCRTTQDDSATRPQLEEKEDANPSRALTSQIASSVMQERCHVRGTEAAPPPVPPKAQSRWNAPTHRGAKSQSSAIGTKSASTRSAQKTRSVPPSRRPSEDDDDPFPYDKPERHELVRRASPPGGLRIEKKAAEPGIDGYPCPFRRRNPVLFNVRDYEQCAQRPFANMTELKRHVRTCHRRRKTTHHCPRCKEAFENEMALGDHLTVSVEDMCEPRPTMSAYLVEDGITEATERALADGTAEIRSWPELWWLLFPQDTSVLDSDFNPVVEAVEAEQEFDDSSAELKADLCDALKRILPDQAGNGPLFQVLAGQIQLVLEQHRAKVIRRCRNNASNADKSASLDRAAKSKTTRFSVATTAYGSQGGGGGGRRSSIHPERTRKSQGQQPTTAPRMTSISPASSVYSQGSGSHYSLSAATRSNSLSSAGGALHVESPRLPFRDWVYGVRCNNNNNNNNNNNSMNDLNNPPAVVAKGVDATSPPLGQRDSGLALQCEECRFEECQCGGSYADHLSALLTPAVGMGSLAGAHEALSRAIDEDDDDDDDYDGDLANLYDGRLLSAGGPGHELPHARSPVVQRPQGEFI